MSQSNLERKLENIAEQVTRVAAGIDTRLVGNDMARRVSTLSRRLEEHRGGSFIALVVGPVKSGKSTLVNLLSHRYVSPTDKLECTVRPSIVSGVAAGEPEQITVYRSRRMGQQAADLDLVIDELRGVATDAGDALETVRVPLSRDEVDRVVFPAFNVNDDTLITGITVNDSPLLTPRQGGQVFLVDMPGFDGNNANFIDDPRYDAMSRRVDLILFVHSSVSAFNVTASSYLDCLRTHNQGAPVVLVHNVFDSAYWRDDDTRVVDVERQINAELDEIQRKGFNIKHENCHAINLGMVDDYLTGNYTAGNEATLRAEAERFAEAEQRLREMIVNSISDLRIERCLERARLMRDALVADLDEAVAACDKVLAAQREVAKRIASLRADCAMPQLEVTKIVNDAQEQATMAMKVLDSDIRSGSHSLDRNGCIDHLTSLARDYFELVNHNVSNLVLGWYRTRVTQYDAMLRDMNVTTIAQPTLTRETTSLMGKFLPDGVAQFVPEKPLFKRVFSPKYSADEVRDHVRALKGYLEVDSRFTLRVTAEVEELAAAYINQVDHHYRNAVAALAAGDTAERHRALTALRNDLNNIIFSAS